MKVRSLTATHFLVLNLRPLVVTRRKFLPDLMLYILLLKTVLCEYGLIGHHTFCPF